MESLDSDAWALLVLIAIAATLYSSVGHGGASGYLAAMALVGLPAASMKPAALAMNIVVAGLVGLRLYRAGYFDARLFWPLAAGSVPFAFLGGAYRLSDPTYRYIVAVALTVAAARLVLKDRGLPPRGAPSVWLAVPIGAGLGFVSGLTGVGGGIFLSPLLMLARFATVRATAAVSAAFIFVNSAAGLAGHALTAVQWPAGLPWMMAVAFLGAVAGSEIAVRRAAPLTLRRLLALVLAIAAVKLVAT